MNLLLSIFIPIIGGLFLLFGASDKPYRSKLIANTFSVLTGISVISLWLNFDINSNVFQFKQILYWLPNYGINFMFGIDGVSLYLILLTCLTITLCIHSSWVNVKRNYTEYVALLLIMEGLLFLAFSALDLILFYVAFESILIPMFFLIGLWGSGARRIKANYYFFLYTLFGSLFMLVGLLTIYYKNGTTDILANIGVVEHRLSCLGVIAWLCIFIAFAIKIPMLPFHIWLPEAHVEAPTEGSVILAGVLLKLGGYGIYRILFYLLPAESLLFSTPVQVLALLGILYSSMSILRQTDIKRVIAYSSVAHMNFVVIGLFSLNIQGLEGAVLLMLGHGLVSGALFFIVGSLYTRYGSRIIEYFGGLTVVMPLYASVFFFFSLSNMSFPGTSNFVGELLVILGAIQKTSTLTLLASSTMIFSAAYSLWLFNRLSFGDLKTYYIKTYFDLVTWELAVLLPLIVLTLVMGIYPDIFLSYIHPSTYNLSKIFSCVVR